MTIPVAVREWLPESAMPRMVRERGFKMAVCEITDEAQKGNPRALRGEVVTLDGVDYRVVAVETYAVPDGHPASRGPFALVLDAVVTAAPTH